MSLDSHIARYGPLINILIHNTSSTRAWKERIDLVLFSSSYLDEPLQHTWGESLLHGGVPLVWGKFGIYLQVSMRWIIHQSAEENQMWVSWGKSNINWVKCVLHWMILMLIFLRKKNLALLITRVFEVGNIYLFLYLLRCLVGGNRLPLRLDFLFL